MGGQGTASQVEMEVAAAAASKVMRDERRNFLVRRHRRLRLVFSPLLFVCFSSYIRKNALLIFYYFFLFFSFLFFSLLSSLCGIKEVCK